MRRLHPTIAARRGMTLVEAVLSIVIVGIMLAAALGTVGASKTAAYRSSDRARAVLVAQDLMSEILRQPYRDASATGSLGPEAGEAGDSRALFDDADDYHGLSAQPQRADGTTITGTGAWLTLVTVEYVSRSSPTTVVTADQGAKRVTVKVTRAGAELASLVAIRTSAR